MFSKYIRELLMKRFNHFWKSQVPNIKPTAGYPEDAKRFITEINNVLTKLKINKNEIWRIK
jgi:rRNA pseudouridine-1189 N-methylase Emg1 (Nep1/Mra1 family)